MRTFLLTMFITVLLAGLVGCESYEDARARTYVAPPKHESDLHDCGADSYVDLNVARYLKLIHEDLLRLEKHQEKEG